MRHKLLLFILWITIGVLCNDPTDKIDDISEDEKNQSVNQLKVDSKENKLKKIFVKLPKESSTSFLIKPLFSKTSPGTIYFKSDSDLTKESELLLSMRIDTNKILDWESEKLKDYRVTIFYPWDIMPYNLAIPMRLSGVTRANFTSDANLILGDAPWPTDIPDLIKSIKKYQRYNHFPLTWEFGCKDKLWEYYVTMKKKFPSDYNYMPETYLLPKDKKIFFSKLDEDPKAMWLIKPKVGASGNGIKLMTDKNSIPEDCLITRYISNPHLINNKKYDLRLYVLVTGFTTIKIYLFPEGLVRFATEDYNNEDVNQENMYMHLTNWSINKNSNKFDNDNINVNDECKGSTWSVGALRNYFKSQNQDFEDTWKQIKDIVAKTVISIADKTIKTIRFLTNNRNNLFELYGYDILIDENLHPWLLEVNTMPAFESVTWLDLKIKSGFMSSLLNIIGLVPYSKKDNDEKQKLLYEEEIYNCTQEKAESHDLPSNDQETNLTCSESHNASEVINYSLDEFSRSGVFERVFPLKSNIDYYSKFIRNPKEDNLILWEYMKNNAEDF